MNRRTLFILFLFFITCSLTAQQKHAVKLLAKSNGKAIMLRWAPIDALLWNYANKNGYVLERYTITRGEELLRTPEKTILNAPLIKPRPLPQWKADADQNDFSAIAAEAIYGTNFELKTPANRAGVFEMISKTKEQDQRFSMALFAADHSFKTALLSGLAFKDSTAKKNEKYLYRLYIPSVIQALKADTAAYYIGLRDTTSAAPPAGLKAEFADRTIKLQWPRAVVEQVYTSFVIERSADNGKNFKRINKVPFVGFPAPSDPDFTAVDSLPANDIVYYYRIRGVTPFGETGPASDVVSGLGFKPMKARASIKGAKEMKNSSVMIDWNVIGEADLIKGFQIERAPQEGGMYTSITAGLIPSSTRNFSDDSPFSTNYYRIKATGQHGETSLSMPYLVQLADSIPPVPPEGLQIKVDTLGIVSLAWKPNSEKDLIGYRVFRSNFKSSEYSQITSTVVKESLYTDTISLKSLTSKIYYKLVAVDNRHNPSSYSEPVVVDKPDRIIPLAPVFKSIKAVAGGVDIQWIKSASEDVNSYVLQRRLKTSPTWEEVKSFSVPDSLMYHDVPPDLTREFYYSLIAIDHAGNKSVVSKQALGKALPATRKRAIKDIRYEIDRTEKLVRLQWQYTEPLISKYVIYKSIEGAPLSMYQTIPAKSVAFEDKSLVMNTSYIYRMKAVFSDGSESGFSDEVKVSF